MNHTDAFGQTYGPGDLVMFSSGGSGRSTCLHIAEVINILPVKSAYSTNAEFDYPDGREWTTAPDGRRVGPRRVVTGVDVRVRTVATTEGRNGEVGVRRPTTPKTRNIVKWTGLDPRTEATA